MDDNISDIINPDILPSLFGNEAAADFLEARLLIEPLIAGLAAERHTDEDCNSLSELLDKCRRMIDNSESVSSINGEFHILIARASRNRFFLLFMESIVQMLMAITKDIEIEKDFLEWELDSHMAILAAIKTRNAGKASLAMQTHIRVVSTQNRAPDNN